MRPIKAMTLAEANEGLKASGLSIRMRDGEYRVSFTHLDGFRRGEDTAYYTNDVEDAYWTGVRMSEDAGKLSC